MILCLMLATLDIPFILEQPASSLMQYHPHFQYLCKRFDIYRVPLTYTGFESQTEWKKCVQLASVLRPTAGPGLCMVGVLRGHQWLVRVQVR